MILCKNDLQHCFVLLDSHDFSGAYSCPTCGTIAVFDDKKWVQYWWDKKRLSWVTEA